MIENQPIHISQEDILQANQLSLHCPICASAVENNVDGAALQPVLCTKCGTLYHRACWDQSGGRCAILGCGSAEYRVYGQDLGPVMVITHADLPRIGRQLPTDAQQKRLKAAERQRQRETGSFWSQLFERILRAIRLLE
jgi:hypothetical protein